MKKLRLLLTCCIALSLLVSACSVNNTDEQTTIPLLLHVKIDDGTATYLGAWNLEQGSVTMDEKLYQSASSRATHPTLWDGKNSFVMDALPLVENKDLSFDNYQVIDGDMIYF